MNAWITFLATIGGALAVAPAIGAKRELLFDEQIAWYAQLRGYEVGGEHRHQC